MDAQPHDERRVKLAIVEVLDRDGHVRASLPVWQWPVTIGRAVDCDLVLDDPHVAARHATLGEDAGRLVLDVGETINGVRLGRRPVAAGTRVDLPPGEILECGATRLRVRRLADPLAAEQPLVPEPVGGRWTLVLLILGVAAWNAGAHWLDSDPGASFATYLPVMLGVPLALVVWSGMWAAVSRLVRHRFDFPQHARIAFGYSLVVSLLGLVLPLAAFASGWTLLARLSGLAGSAIGLAMVHAHLSRVLPARRRAIALVMAVLFAAGSTLYLVRSYQVNDRLFDQLYLTTLGPPSLRLASPVSTATFFEEARQLKARLDAHVDDDEEGEEIDVDD